MRYRRRDFLILLTAFSFIAAAGCEKELSQEELLLKQLTDPSPDQRWNAALSLREMQPVPIVYLPHLIKSLDDEDPRVRHAAAQALGEVGSEGRAHINELAKLSNEHPDSQVRFALQQAVMKINRSQ